METRTLTTFAWTAREVDTKLALLAGKVVFKHAVQQQISLSHLNRNDSSTLHVLTIEQQFLRREIEQRHLLQLWSHLPSAFDVPLNHVRSYLRCQFQAASLDATKRSP